MLRSDFGIIFWLHTTIIGSMYAAPFLFNLKVVLLALFVYWLQVGYLGYCVLTRLQFAQKHGELSFYSYYLRKLGLFIDKKTITIISDRILPIVILVLALVWQGYFDHRPLIF